MTIATSTLISAFNSLTLSPALSALLLRPREVEEASHEVLPRWAYPLLGFWIGYEFLSPWVAGGGGWGAGDGGWGVPALPWITAAVAAIAGLLVSRPLDRVLDGAFRRFNQAFNAFTRFYGRTVGRLLRLSAAVLVVYGGLLVLTWWGFTQAPAGFIPMQDKGYLLVNVQLPDAASVERTGQVMDRLQELCLGTERLNSARGIQAADGAKIVEPVKGISHTVAIAGQSLLLGANAPNFGAMYVMLKDFHERTRAGLSGDAIAAQLQETIQAEVPEGVISIFGAPPVEGLGTAGGFKLMIEDRRGDNGLDALQDVGKQVVDAGNDTRGLQGLFTSFRSKTPWLFLDIDRPQAKTMGISIAEIFDTLQVFLGSLYVNDFNDFSRTWQVNVQGDANYRREIEDVKQIKVRNAMGAMVPLGTVMSPRPVSGPVMIVRYNMYGAAPINGNAAPGVSSGEAIARMARVADKELERLPGMQTEWTELAMLQLQTGNTAMYVFLLAVVLVFLVLAAQYESWSLPLAVILVVPMCLLFSIAGVVLARMDIDIFTQVGFVVLVGLACKNAILIVEFAKVRHESGASPREATLAACQPPSAADHDDLAGLHHRRDPAGGLPGRRGRDAAHAGHGGLQRDARRDALRHLPHAGLLLRHPMGRRAVWEAVGSCQLAVVSILTHNTGPQRRPASAFRLLMECDGPNHHHLPLRQTALCRRARRRLAGGVGHGRQFVGLEARPLDHGRQQLGLGGVLGNRRFQHPKKLQKLGREFARPLLGADFVQGRRLLALAASSSGTPATIGQPSGRTLQTRTLPARRGQTQPSPTCRVLRRVVVFVLLRVAGRVAGNGLDAAGRALGHLPACACPWARNAGRRCAATAASPPRRGPGRTRPRLWSRVREARACPVHRRYRSVKAGCASTP